MSAPRPTDGDARRAAARLVRRLDGVFDPAQWPLLVREFCEGGPPEVTVARLGALLEAAIAGQARSAWLAVAQSLCGELLPYELLAALYRSAHATGADGVRLLLIAGEHARRTARDSEFQPDALLDGVTLGERKALARRPDVMLLERLLADADPDVIRILLTNPKLTEPLVVRLTARRPNRAAVLAEVARSRRWLARTEVQRALVLNPYTPARVAVAVAPLLAAPDLREVARDGNLHAMVRQFAARLLTLRSAR